MLRHGSLFSGIGGFDLASDWMGWENVFHCEWNPFGQRVLKYYWPNSISHNDITKTDFSIYRGEIDIITGGFPCQPYSTAGKRLGKEDNRHLWPEMLRAIREIKPRWVVGENVRGLISWNGGMVFEEVQADLESEGYEVQPFILPAASVNAPHRRDRIWFVAFNSKSNRDTKVTGIWERKNDESIGICKENINATNSKFLRLEHGEKRRGFTESKGKTQTKGSSFTKQPKTNCWTRFPTVSPICDGDDGLSDRLDSINFSKWRNESIKAGGNAIVPQVVYQIFKTIEQYEYNNR